MHTYDSSMTPQIIKEFSEIAKSAISESTTEVVKTVGGGIELGVSTSKTQINDFLAALTAWMASMSNTHYVNPKTIVQQQDLSVKDIELEQKTSKIEIDQHEIDRLAKIKAQLFEKSIKPKHLWCHG